MTRTRPYIAVLLALMLGLTSLTLAAARGHAPAMGEVEICSGLGLQVIRVDADGNPVGPPHLCPDAVASFVSVDAPLPVLPRRLLANGETLRLPARLASAGAARLRATARDPPVPV
ncbi:hypothetical protein [Actibacterium sp. D379-3]